MTSANAWPQQTDRRGRVPLTIRTSGCSARPKSRASTIRVPLRVLRGVSGFRVLDGMRVADQRLRVVCGRQKWCTISVKSRIGAAVLFVVLNISCHF